MIVDVNGDGKPDIVVANCGGGCQSYDEGSVGVLLGNGDGTFQAPVSYSAWSVGSVAVADLNGDGYPDLVASNYCQRCRLHQWSKRVAEQRRWRVPARCVELRGARIPQLFRSRSPYVLKMTANRTCWWRATGCLDWSCGSGSVGVLLGNGDGACQPAARSRTDAGAGGLGASNSVAVADVNGDGYPDLVAADMGVWPYTYGEVSVAFTGQRRRHLPAGGHLLLLREPAALTR